VTAALGTRPRPRFHVIDPRNGGLFYTNRAPARRFAPARRVAILPDLAGVSSHPHPPPEPSHREAARVRHTHPPGVGDPHRGAVRDVHTRGVPAGADARALGDHERRAPGSHARPHDRARAREPAGALAVAQGHRAARLLRRHAGRVPVVLRAIQSAVTVLWRVDARRAVSRRPGRERRDPPRQLAQPGAAAARAGRHDAPGAGPAGRADPGPAPGRRLAAVLEPHPRARLPPALPPGAARAQGLHHEEGPRQRLYVRGEEPGRRAVLVAGLVRARAAAFRGALPDREPSGADDRPADERTTPVPPDARHDRARGALHVRRARGGRRDPDQRPRLERQRPGARGQLERRRGRRGHHARRWRSPSCAARAIACARRTVG